MSRGSPRPIRVLIVDDSAFARKVVREIFETDRSRFEVVGIAHDGLDALEKISALEPDVVTLDLVMPSLDGVGVLRELRSLLLQKAPRVVLVSMAQEDSELVVLALQLGAFDLVRKPTALATDRLYELSAELMNKVVMAADAKPTRLSGGEVPFHESTSSGSQFTTKRRMLVIGTSTGGPQALTKILPALPGNFPLPVAIVLHIPAGYTEALAKRLNDSCALQVIEAYDGVEFVRGRVVIAKAGHHMRVVAGDPLRGRLDLHPIESMHRPSVDVLFESAAEALGDTALGVVLTGMGDDGTRGARALRTAGAPVLTEKESSCVVYGMPRSVKEAGLCCDELDLEGFVEGVSRHL